MNRSNATAAVSRVVLAVSMAGSAASAFAAQTTVNFIDAEHYRDATYSVPMRNNAQLSDVERDLTKAFQTSADKALPADAVLTLDILDVDLAGRIEPGLNQAGDNIRLVRDTDWPRIKLRFTLTEPGKPAASGEETLKDMDFLRTARSSRYLDGDRLRYERAMIDEWFAKRFAER